MNSSAPIEEKPTNEEKGADEDKKTDEEKKTGDAKGTNEDKRAKAQERIQELYNKRSSFIHEDMTGYVWLYLQK